MSDKNTNADLEIIREWLDHGIPERIEGFSSLHQARVDWDPDATDEDREQAEEFADRCEEVAEEVRSTLEMVETLLSDLGLTDG